MASTHRKKHFMFLWDFYKLEAFTLWENINNINAESLFGFFHPQPIWDTLIISCRNSRIFRPSQKKKVTLLERPNLQNSRWLVCFSEKLTSENTSSLLRTPEGSWASQQEAAEERLKNATCQRKSFGLSPGSCRQSVSVGLIDVASRHYARVSRFKSRQRRDTKRVVSLKRCRKRCWGFVA